MAAPIFGANSRLDLDIITTVPAAATLSPKTNLRDDRVYTTFKPTSSGTTVDIVTDAGASVAVDYFMMIGHDLSDPALDGLGAVLLTFARSADDISYTTIFSVTPSDDLIIARSFASVSDRFFRVRLTRGTAFIPAIGQAQWGVAVQAPFGMEVGFDPDAEQINNRFNQSQTGNMLGATQTFVQRRASINLPLVPNSFVNGTAVGDFGEFWDNHARKLLPFLFLWNPGNPGSFEKDAMFAQVDPATSIRRPLRTQLDVGFRDLSFEVLALGEEE